MMEQSEIMHIFNNRQHEAGMAAAVDLIITAEAELGIVCDDLLKVAQAGHPAAAVSLLDHLLSIHRENPTPTGHGFSDITHETKREMYVVLQAAYPDIDFEL